MSTKVSKLLEKDFKKGTKKKHKKWQVAGLPPFHLRPTPLPAFIDM